MVQIKIRNYMWLCETLSSLFHLFQVRERLKSAINRSTQLEQELADLKGTTTTTKDEKGTKVQPPQIAPRKRDATTVTDQPYLPSEPYF